MFDSKRMKVGKYPTKSNYELITKLALNFGA